MKILYKAAAVLRNAIKKADRWNFSGSFTVKDKQMPKELYSFFRWVLEGPNASLSTDQKSAQVNRHATSLAQSTVSSWLVVRQTSEQQKVKGTQADTRNAAAACSRAGHKAGKQKQKDC